MGSVGGVKGWVDGERVGEWVGGWVDGEGVGLSLFFSFFSFSFYLLLFFFFYGGAQSRARSKVFIKLSLSPRSVEQKVVEHDDEQVRPCRGRLHDARRRQLKMDASKASIFWFFCFFFGLQSYRTGRFRYFQVLRHRVLPSLPYFFSLNISSGYWVLSFSKCFPFLFFKFGSFNMSSTWFFFFLIFLGVTGF